jgi:hypothetical protein
MHLTVLAVPGCPNAPVLRDRLAAALDDRADVSVSRQVISDETEAARWGVHGSPTLLIDGVDPFAVRGQPPSLSCRLYRDEHGRTSGAPSVGQLRQAIGQALAAAAGLGDLAWLDSLGRAGRGRVACRTWSARSTSGGAAIVRADRGCARHLRLGQAR